MSKIRLSTGVAMPLDAVTRTFGIFGQRGTGKSTTAAVFVEQAVCAGGRAVVLDPTGVWHGLTREGSGPGLAGVVLGGEQGDAPLEPTGGDLVAEFVISTDYPLVVLDMKLMRKHQRQTFAMELLERLYHDNRDALMVVIDEAPQFAPTRIPPATRGELNLGARLLGAVEDVVTLGRSRGLGVTLISQRFATVNATVREQVETIVVHRLVGKLDRTALSGWIEANGDPEREKEVMGLIAKLPTGRALVWSPAFLDFFGVIDVNNATTYDSRATPSVGAPKRKLTARAPIDLAELETRMAATLEEHAAKDPAQLRRRIAELEKQIAANDALTYTRSEPVEVEVEVEVPVLTDEMMDRLVETIAPAADAMGPIKAFVEQFGQIAIAIAGAQTTNGRPRAEQGARREPREAVRREPTAPVERPNLGAVAPAPPAAAPTGAPIGGGERKILEALASHYPMRVRLPQLGTLSGYAWKGGTFKKYVGILKREAMIVDAAGEISITDAGMEQFGGTPPPPKTPAEMLAMWLDALEGPPSRLLQELVASHPDGLTREELAERTGYEAAGGTFKKYVSILKRNDLITDFGGVLRADETLCVGAPA